MPSVTHLSEPSDAVNRARTADHRHVVIVAGGAPPSLPLPRTLDPYDEIIAADGGVAFAQRLGLHVDRVVGDLDSVSPTDLAAAHAAGAAIEQHPIEKDATDLALALDAAARGGPARVTVVGGHGGRLDHLFAGMGLLASPTYRDLEITALMGTAIVTVVHTAATLTGSPGDIVSLVPVHGPASDVHTTGLRYALHGERLDPGSSRGVSNILVEPRATIRLGAGSVLVIQPGATTPDTDPR